MKIRKIVIGISTLLVLVSMVFLIAIGASISNKQKMIAIGKKTMVENQPNENWKDGTIQGQVWGYLKEKGLNEIQIAGIMGNIQRESGFNPSTIEQGNGIGYGLCQWSFGRRIQLLKYASSMNTSPSNILLQLDFFWQEFSPSAQHTYGSYQWINDKYSYDMFMNATTIEATTTIFCHGWERCATSESLSALNSVRIPAAKSFYNLYKGTNGSIGNGGSDIVTVALSQAGNIGGEPYWSWYGFSGRVEWCACFVSWCADKSGLISAKKVPKYAYCPSGIQWFKEQGQWQENGTTPKSGYIIFFDWNSDGISDHTGIVNNVQSGYVNTIEGNSDDAWAQRSYPIHSNVIVGYGTY